MAALKHMAPVAHGITTPCQSSAVGCIGHSKASSTTGAFTCHAGVEPNVVTYTTVMGVLHRSGQWQMAMRIFKKMEGAGIQADVKAYNAAIAACAKGCNWQQAWSVFAGLFQPACSCNRLSVATSC